MSRFNTPVAKPAVHSPIATAAVSTVRTHEGGVGYARDAKSELFLLAVTNMVGQDTFYEKAGSRDERFERLVRQVAIEDSGWLLRFAGWLRGEANMRTASLVAAAEAVHARLAGHTVKNVHPRTATPTAVHARSVDRDAENLAPRNSAPADRTVNRRLIEAVCQRADEPGELLAYWTSRYGRAIPKPVKRGVADAMLRLGTEFNYVKWDSEGHGYRFADLLNLTHPGDRKGSAQRIRGPWQHDLFGYIVKRPHQPDLPVPESLGTLTRRQALLALPVDERRTVLESPEVLKQAGMTWEALAGWLQGPMDAKAWSAIIPSMGYMALLRNLRNFDEAGVSDTVALSVAAKLADPAEVAHSRQLPFRFLSAYRAAPSLRWAYPLERALGMSLANIPALGGRTLILVDTSSSMDSGFSKDGSMRRWDAAALFGIALGHRCTQADVVSFSSLAFYIGQPGGANVKHFPLTPGESVLRSLERWKSGGWFLGGGTETAAALRAAYRGHDRVVIVTDEQAARDGREVTASVPDHIPLYTWNLAGYAAGHAPSGSRNRHAFGGLTDQAFKMIPLLESGHDGTWPF